MTNRFEIEPRRGVNGLALGASRAEVRDFFGNEWQPFRRTPEAEEQDYWPKVAVFASYDAEQKLEVLEFAAPAEVLLEGDNLVGVHPSQAERTLRRADSNTLSGKDGARSNQAGVAIWSDGFDDGTPVQSVLVSRGGY